MSIFEKICDATIDFNAKKVSLLLLEENSSIDQLKDLALTPAGFFAQKGDWEKACWLMTEFNANVGSILYGGIIGGHVTSLTPDKEKLSDAEQKIWEKYTPKDNEKMMIIGFAQLGKADIVQEKTADTSLMRSAILGATYGNQTVLIESLLNEKDGCQLQNAIKGAACGGHQDQTLKYMQYYKKNFPDQIKFGRRAQDYALQGASQSERLELIQHLNKHYDADIDVAIREAMRRNNDDFVFKLIDEFQTIKFNLMDKALISGALLTRASLVEKFMSLLAEKYINVHIYYNIIAGGARHWASSAEILIAYLALFNSTALVEHLCLALSNNQDVKKDVKEAMPTIQTAAIEIIKYKQQYRITTQQALYLYSGKVELNHCQLADTLNKVGKNVAKADLTNALETYLNTQSSWWYNHLERCDDFLTVLKKTPKHKKCKELVAAQYRLFHNPEINHETADHTLPKHQQPVKQNAVKDGYYEAIKKYYDTFFSASNENQQENDTESLFTSNNMH